MKKLFWSTGILFIGLLFTGVSKGQPYSGELDKTEVKKVMQAVADWQIANFRESTYGPASWINGAMYLGMFDWAEMAEELDSNKEYFAFLNKIGNRTGWHPDKRMYHADDVCVCQMYIDMYRKNQKTGMLNPTVARIDWVIAHPSKGTVALKRGDGTTQERWSWCDALFMAPPVYARLYVLTGDRKYIKFMNQEYKATYDYLYSKEEDLFFRDQNYFEQKEKNGEHVFWSRGNGWVMGGLCEILQELPKGDRNRKFYQELFVKMAGRIVELQRVDGYWSASMLDPDSYPSPETSGTGFFVYALAYGVNEGLLPADRFVPAIEKGWKALVGAVEENGKLGYVQPVGETPKTVTANMTEAYGVGAFLLAGKQVYRMAK